MLITYTVYNCSNSYLSRDLRGRGGDNLCSAVNVDRHIGKKTAHACEVAKKHARSTFHSGRRKARKANLEYIILAFCKFASLVEIYRTCR